jgi:beta-glucosidase
MPGTTQQSAAIISAVQHDSLSVKVLDENVERLLTVMLESPAFKGFKFSDKPDLVKDATLSRMAAAEGMILLKNDDNTLPLKSKGVKVALFGNNGYDLIAGGTGSGDVNKAYTIALSQGLAGAGMNVDAALQKTYADYLKEEKIKHPKKGFFEEFMHPTPPIAEFVADEKLIAQKAAEDAVAIISIGRNAGEGADRKLAGDYYLNDTEMVIIKTVANAFHAQHKKVVVVLNTGGVIDVARWRDNVDAILLAWQPGMEGGNAIADVISGKVNPSGKLATTFPVEYADVPSAKSFPGQEFPEKAASGMFGMRQIPAEVTYEEGIYVGYRYYNTFKVKPAYEFGYGLSYTKFAYSNLKISKPAANGNITATVKITNTGKVAGKEVVQLYVSAPAVKMAKPAEELKAFAKTNLLQPGGSQTIQFVITPADLASFDTNSTSWIAEAGKYTFKVAASSEDVKQSAIVEIPKDVVTEKCHKVLVPQVEINELKK